MKRLKIPLNVGEITFVLLCTFAVSAVFGFICFLSLNFLSLGETVPSIVFSIIFALLLSIPVFVAICLKKTSRPTKFKIIWEGVLLFLFVVFAFVFVFPFSHYFTVSSQKAVIQSKLITNIEQAVGMFDAYEDYANNRLHIYDGRLRSVANAQNVNPSQFRDFGFEDGQNVNEQIDRKMFTLRARLFPSNYEDIKRVASAWLAEQKNTIANWSPTGIVKIVNSAESEITAWRNELKQLSSFRAQGENSVDFEFPLTFDDVTDKITELGSLSRLSILIALVLYAIILLPYRAIRRHPRFPGCKTLFKSKSNNHSDSSSGGTIVFN